MATFARPLAAEPTGLSALFANLAATVAVWRQRASVRNELAGLNLATIQDLGLDATAVEREIAKPFWRA